jgi:hypothetical protein
MKAFLILLFFVNSLCSDKILDKQIEILNMMSKDNVKHVSNPLINFSKKSDKKTRDLALLEGAIHGNAYALRILGYQKIEKQRQEGLILLCEASILGDKIAICDLPLMPKIMDIKVKEIETSCIKAVHRLKDKKTILGHRRAVLEPNVEDKLNNFELLRKKRGMDYVSYINYLSKNVDIYTRRGYKAFQNILLKKDIPKVAKNKRLALEANDIKNAKGEKRAILERNKVRNIASVNLLRDEKISDLKQFEVEINKQLLLINKHRSNKRQISPQSFWEIIKEIK